MSYLCCIPGCPNEKNYSKDILYPFPDNEDVRKRWIHVIKIINFPISSMSRICSTHFTDADFMPCLPGDSKRMLKEGAIPSVFPAVATKDLKCRISTRHSHMFKPDGSDALKMEFDSEVFSVSCFICGKGISKNEHNNFEGCCLIGSRTVSTNKTFVNFLKDVLVGVLSELHHSMSYVCERCNNLVETLDILEVKVGQTKGELRRLYQDHMGMKSVNASNYNGSHDDRSIHDSSSKLSCPSTFDSVPYFPFESSSRHPGGIQNSASSFNVPNFTPSGGDRLDISNLCRVELQEESTDPAMPGRVPAVASIEGSYPASGNNGQANPNNPMGWISQMLEDITQVPGKRPRQGEPHMSEGLNKTKKSDKVDKYSREVKDDSNCITSDVSNDGGDHKPVFQNNDFSVARYPYLSSAFHSSSSSNNSKTFSPEETNSSNTIFCCPESACEAHFKTRSGLMNHLRHHRTEGPLECQQCHKQFSWWAHLVSHAQLVHGDLTHVPPLYTCETCKCKFKDLEAFRQHVHTSPVQSDPTQYKCNHCNAGFPTLSMLNSHKTKEHLEDNTFQCPMCVKTFHRRYNLLRHLENHDKNEDPERYYQFTCHVCGAVFYRKDHLGRHLRIHQNIKPYECSVCKKTFRRNDGLSRHQKLH